MSGGLLQLVAIGAQDMYTTGNPQVTLFKSTYRRHTNFAVEAIEAPFNGAADFGKRVQCTIPRNGDLINRGYIQVTLPQVHVPRNKEFRWLNWIGHALIKSVEVEVGGQRMDRHYGDWIHIYNEYNQEAGKRVGYANMVGNVPMLTQLYEPDTDKGVVVPSVTLYIPLIFWFNRNVGLSLPLIALQYHEVKINVEFRDKKECCWNPSGIQVDGLASASIWFDYVFLDTEERRRTAQISHEYLIDQLQFTGDESITAEANKIKLSLNHPTKAIYFVIQLDMNVTSDPMHDIKKGQQWFNYTDATDLTYYSGTPGDPLGGGMAGDENGFNQQSLPLFSTGILTDQSNIGFTGSPSLPWTLNQSSQVPNDGTTNSTSQIVKLPLFDTGVNPVVTAKLQLNGHDRFAEREGRYFNLVQPFQHHNNIPATGINMYAFAYKPFDHQPTGSCNMSRIDSIVFQLRVTRKTASSGAKARFYGVSINVFRLTAGMGGQAYSSFLSPASEDILSIDFI